MTTQTHPVTLGTVSGTPIVADLKSPGVGTHPWDLISVHMSTNYVTANPPGYPARPPAGQAASKLGQLGTVQSGTTLKLFAHEAAALVAASAATYA
jgi:hypothetical protein